MMSTISMVDARAIMIACYHANEPLLLLGPPGMGKTSLYESVARFLNISFIDFRLTMRDVVDVGGMRVPDMKTGILRHFVPEDLPDPKRHGSKGIMLFDEINVVSQMMQAAAYGIIQERRNGSYRMADGWVPMAAGNNVKDRAAAQRISSALLNRFNVQHVAPDLSSWLVQYGSENVDSRGCAFLRFRPGLFHLMPGDPIPQLGETMEEATARVAREGNNGTLPIDQPFPTARSWTKAFKFINEDPPLRRKIFRGHVGEIAAEEFEAYWRIMENAPTIQDIIDDPLAAKLPSEQDAGTNYAVAGMLARLMDRKNIKPIMKYVGRMQPDYQVAVVQDATRRDEGLKVSEAYTSWAVKNQEAVL